MHVFQPYPISEIEFNPFTASGNTGFCITALVGKDANVMASSSAGFGKLWGKDVVFAFVRESRYTKELMDKSEFFSLTFFEEQYKTSLKYIKSVSGRTENKIEAAGFHINKHIEIPFIDEGMLVFLCDKIASIPLSDKSAADAFLQPHIKDKFYKDEDYHYIFIGEILEILAR